MKPLLRRDGQAAFLGDGDEVSEVPQLHGAIPEKYGFDPTKSFSHAPARSTPPATAAEIPQSGNQAGEDQDFRQGPTGIRRNAVGFPAAQQKGSYHEHSMCPDPRWTHRPSPRPRA